MNKLSFPKKLLSRLGLFSLLLTLILLILGQFQTAIAWWIMIACLLPALTWSTKSRALSVKTFVWITFITQGVTVLNFYLNPSEYNYQSYRPFYFTGLESLQVFYKVGIFLMVFLFVTNILERLLKLSRKKGNLLSVGDIDLATYLRGSFNPSSISQSTSLIATGLIIGIIILMIPLNNWTFQMGIGITGAEPPRLPYRLSGILSYFTRIVIPLILILLYLRTRRQSLLLVVILGLYSIFLGVSTVSRATVFILIIPPLVFALLDRRWILLGVATLFFAISMALTTFSREIVLIVVENVSTSNVRLGVVRTMLRTAQTLEWDRLWLIIPQIIGRLESFESLWLASNVNPSSLGGGWAVWIKVLDWQLIDLGHNTIHQEVLGYTVPLGFYNVSAGTLAYMLWALGESWFFYFPFSVLYGSFLVFQEVNLRAIAMRYAISPLFINPITYLLSLSYFISPGFPTGNFLLLSLFIFSRLQRFRVLANFLASIGVCSKSNASSLSPNRLSK